LVSKNLERTRDRPTDEEKSAMTDDSA